MGESLRDRVDEALAAPKPETGYRVVIATRAAAEQYGGEPFSKLFALAVAGVAGLRPDVMGSTSCEPALGECRFRELRHEGSRFHGASSLNLQRW